MLNTVVSVLSMSRHNLSNQFWKLNYSDLREYLYFLILTKGMRTVDLKIDMYNVYIRKYSRAPKTRPNMDRRVIENAIKKE